MNILITGTAGFIGYHLVKRLVSNSNLFVVGIDNINTYYDTELKIGRLSESGISGTILYGELMQSDRYDNYHFIKLDLCDKEGLSNLFKTQQFDVVINLAAQAGVRYSLKVPEEYISSNVSGFLNIIECCRNYSIKHLLYASSSSVYGLSDKSPFKEGVQTDFPANLYGATKKMNELMAFAYGNLYNLPSTGLRFFTVYGPWGRPDMALMIFTKAIIEGSPIMIHNNGNHTRDFTYVEDVVYGISKLLYRDLSVNPTEVYNIGSGRNISLISFIELLEDKLGKKAIKEMNEKHNGDMLDTLADTSKFEREFNKLPITPFEDGIDTFIQWYNNYYC